MATPEQLKYTLENRVAVPVRAAVLAREFRERLRDLGLPADMTLRQFEDWAFRQGAQVLALVPDPAVRARMARARR